MRHGILFDERSTSQFSRVFSITPNSRGVISAYNLSVKSNPSPHESTRAAQHAVIQKVFFNGSCMGDCDCGCDDSNDELDLSDFNPDLMYAEDVTQGGIWHLSPCQNTGILLLPGAYRLFLDDEGAPGNVFISLVRYSFAEFRDIPRGLVFGEQ